MVPEEKSNSNRWRRKKSRSFKSSFQMIMIITYLFGEEKVTVVMNFSIFSAKGRSWKEDSELKRLASTFIFIQWHHNESYATPALGKVPSFGAHTASNEDDHIQTYMPPPKP